MRDTLTPAITFERVDLPLSLDAIQDAGFDALEFGVIGFDDEGIVRVYNRFESEAAALSRERVIGIPIFTGLAQCMNNYMVAQRFEDARADGVALDATIEFVLTWRMRPTPVKLRMIATPGARLRYVVLQRA